MIIRLPESCEIRARQREVVSGYVERLIRVVADHGLRVGRRERNALTLLERWSQGIDDYVDPLPLPDQAPMEVAAPRKLALIPQGLDEAATILDELIEAIVLRHPDDIGSLQNSLSVLLEWTDVSRPHELGIAGSSQFMSL